MNCFVTGANGFLGSALCARLEARGDSVIQGARRLPGAPTRHRVQFDLSGPPLAANQLRDVACVFHLAGKAHALSETRQAEAEYFSINTDGTRKLLESCQSAEVRRFVFFSSVKTMAAMTSGVMTANTPIVTASTCNIRPRNAAAAP